ncbi:MAG: cryptochrome/photolyase family protein [Anaerolineales bacterium]|jgi:deoxyribodipyrimidine photolyase-related protein
MTVTVWILGDQLCKNHPALDYAVEQYGKSNIVILMLESEKRAGRISYHAKKLVLLFSAMRHIAEHLRMQGFRVDYRISPRTGEAILGHLKEFQPEAVIAMSASEFRGRIYQKNLEDKFGIPVIQLPNTQFLSGRFDPYPDPQLGKRYVQEQFYRRMRRNFQLLVDADGEPFGGKWNFDKDNRRRLPSNQKPPRPIAFSPDGITMQVMEEVGRKYRVVGNSDGFNLAVTREQARQAAYDFFDYRLHDFGAYEDAMSCENDIIYHSKLSPYINLGLLDPLWLAREAQTRYSEGMAPINSVEGFIRQLVGWREYIYWQYWRLMPEISGSNFWGFNRALPEFFWNGETEMNCLKHVIGRALHDGYTHHIERLMVVCNFCLLAGIDPDTVNIWFQSVYIDAYEWVMLPNVYGMGLYADGGMVGTKPYISSANYLSKMSDYCRACVFNHKHRTGVGACPFNYLYWNFILEHNQILKANPRMSRSLLGLRHLDQEDKRLIQESAHQFLNSLV